MSRPTNKSNTKPKATKSPDLYVYSLTSQFQLSPFTLAGASLTASNLELLENAENKKKSVDEQTGPTCRYCGTIPGDAEDPNYIRNHYRRDYHRYNIKRGFHNQSPLTEEEFEKLVGELDESISGSDSSDSEPSDTDDTDPVGRLLKKTKLGSIPEGSQASNNPSDEEDDEKQREITGTPYFLYNAPGQIPEEKVIAVYKSVFNSNYVSPPDGSDISKLSNDGRFMEAIHSLNPNGISCILMIGGGHFSGAIISHSPIPNRPPTPTNPYANMQVIAHKSFHRYTTRRKQGGSQSANDNAHGKANSAGSTLRRYNEAALEKEIRELLREWAKPYISKADSIYIRASGRMNRATLMNYKEAPIVSSDPRIKNLPFTTKRATTTELKRAWWELTHAKIIDKPIPKTVAASKSDTTKATQTKTLSKEEEKLEAHTKELTQLIRRSKVPSLIAYIKKHKLSTAEFRLFPESNQEYSHAPTLLHYASARGSPAVVTSLLRSLGADPTILNDSGKTAYQIADDRATKDAFQLARSVMGEKGVSDSKVSWDWDKDARVGPALTKEEIKARELEEKKARDLENEANRNLIMEAQQKEVDKLKKEAARKLASGRTLGSSTPGRNTVGGQLNKGNIAQLSSTNANLLEMTPDERKKFEREQRAKAIEARLGLNKKK